MSKIYKLMTVLSCLLLLALFTPLSATYAQTCTDVDGDGYGLNGDASCPAPGVDCDDDDPNVYPDAPRICDAKDSDCDGFEDFFTDKDVDGDGSTMCTHWLTGLRDCNDNNPVMYPGNVEGPFGDPTCTDGFDNDCDYKTDASDNGCSVNCVDSDGDGYGNPGNVTCPNGNALDCNDSNDLINPGVTDTNCNGVDDNCSGTADDGYVPTPTNCGTGECASTGTLSCSGGVESDSCVAGAPAKEGALGHPTCSDTLDNDCDGATDGTDVGCQSSCLDDDGDGYGFYGDPSCPNGAVVDCNDDDDQIHPAMIDDVCDGVDANCSGTPDDQYSPTVTNCGIGECTTTGLLECIAGATVDNCSPLAPGTEGPFGDPTCSDTLDNDCDGDIDSGDQSCNPLDEDNDGDGYCEGPTCSDGSTPGDCNDAEAVTYPGATRICDAKDNDCDGFDDFFSDVDGDGDGVPMCGGDCDDNNANRFPGNIEGPWGDATCGDFIDNDCDYRTDGADAGCGIDCLDTDGDGYGNPGNPSCTNGGALDCDNFNAAVNPGATDDVCDGVDANCSGTADDEYVDTPTNCGVGECASTGNLTCSGGVESDSCIAGTPVVEGPLGDATCGDTLDNDCDTFTDGSDPGCQSSCLDDDSDGYGLYGDASCANAGVDCDDKNAAINPGATDDSCDDVDNNCSGTADDEYTPTVTNCGIGECATTGLLICNAGGVLQDNCSPLAPGTEGPFGDPTCSGGLDEDCDGDIDGGDLGCNPLNIDNDLDGFCEGPTCSDGSTPGDCDDTDLNVYPSAPRVCDGKDSDCDGWDDFFTDKDADGDGTTLCVHFQTGLQDCNDNDPNRFPGNIEAFGDPSCDDGIDNDCNYKIDLADIKCLDQCNDGDGDGYGNPAHPSCANPELDCDNSNNLVNPGETDDTCDGVDNNCSGTADDEYVPSGTNCGVGECATTGTLTCSGGVETDSCTPLAPSKEGALGHATCSDTFDNDCDGTTDALDPGCQSSCLDDDGDGYGYYGDASCPNGAVVDCNDDDAAINPGATDDVCDGVDANCSGTADDEYVPTPTNCGIGECATTGLLICNAGVPEDDCTPLAPGVEDYLTAGVCTDTLDNDCDGVADIDDVGCNPPDVDNDGDGYCEVGPCIDATTPGDCDDTDATVHPGGDTTVCDGKDTNCDTWDDFFSDVDNDGDGVPLCAGDCNDNDPDRFPGNKEGPWVDPTCFDGIDNDCDYKTDSADGFCKEPTCTTKTAGELPPDGPHIFDLLDGGDNVLKTPCQWCHFDDSGTVDERAKCERCHADPAWGGPDDGTLKVLYSGNPPYGFGTALNVKKHSSTVVGTTHGAWDMDCITCHNPHMQEMNQRYETNYGKYIKEKICYNNAVTAVNTEELVEFTAPSGPGSFADGPPHNENICEICHTMTNHHQISGLAPGDLDGGNNYIGHEDSNNCTNCHTHLEGFAPPIGGGTADVPHDTITDCTLCHDPGTYVAGATLDNAKCMVCHDGTPATLVDTHHSTKYGTSENCTDCHNVMRSQLPNASHIKLSLVSFTGSDYTHGAPNYDGICETCHTLTDQYRNDNTSPVTNHNVGSVCTSCHTHANGMQTPFDPADTPHDGITDCTECHDTGTYTAGATLDNAKCMVCHDGTPATLVDTHHSTKYGTSENCTDCHNVMRSQLPNASHIKLSFVSFTGSDYTHGAPNYDGICETCHTLTDQYRNDNTSPVTNHNVGSVCTSCHTHANGMQTPFDPADTPHDGITDCTECHDTGTYTAGATLDNAKCMVCHDGTPATLVDTHHSTKYGTSENCTDCHNVMRSQLPNASHIKLSLVSFTGSDYTHGAPNYDGICETCHTLTDQYRNDNTSPVTNHNVGSVCTSCHTHAGGMQIPSDIADTPHDGITDCTLCHDTGTYVAGATLDNAKCMVCHDGTPATLVDTHHSTKYGTSENCTDCHNVMRSQLPNASHIKLILVSFTGSDYTHGAPNYDGICETCHTLTDQYRNDNTSPVTNHNVGSVCTSCHTHAGGMQIPSDIADTPHDGITDCTLCHDTGTYVAGATLDNAKCMVCHDGTPATLVDTHHSTKYGTSENCTDCHNVMRSQLPNASHIKLILVSFTGSDYTHGAPNYDGICETCHTLTDQYRNDNTSPVTNHNVGSVCTSCHTHANGMQTPFDPADTPHDGITDCTECHDTGTYEAGATLDNAKCMVCHDGTPATLVDTHHSTKYGTSENCTDCHNVMRSQLPNTSHIKLTLVSFTGADYVHGSPNYDGICETCHTLTDQYRNDNTSPVTNHNVGSICTSCHTHANGMQTPFDPADTPHDGITDCTECHDTGTYEAGATLDNAKCMVCHDGTPATLVDTHHSTKYGTSENCTDCHNVMRSQLPNASHIKLSLVSFTGADYVHGTPNYDGICETCHTLTDQYRNNNTSPVTNHNVGSVCTSCHTHDTGMQIPVDLADTPHDGITDCTECHDTGTYTAGATLDNAKCMVCHDGTPATLVDTHHSTKYGTSENCTDCHNVMRSQLPNASHIKLILVSFTGSDYTHGAPNYDGICETCHTLTDQYRNDNTSPVTNHNVGSVCTSCHTHANGMQTPFDPADTPHDGITDCTECHDTGTYEAGATLDNAKCMVCHDGTPATLVDTHHSTKYGTSENCTDCHNVMRSQLPNTSHIKLTLVSFTGADYVHGSPNYDGICETCHTLTDQYRNDNTSPVTNHNVGSVCTSCHTHANGMQTPFDPADTPHDGITDCTECHDTGTYTAGATLDNAKCMVCHDGTPATLVDTHHSTKYGTSENCTDCHNVMRSQLPNASHIKLSLVSFTGADYVHGTPNYDGICETCHTLTDQYRNNNTSPVTNHNVGSVCTSCHTHDTGMQIPVDLADTPHDGITDCTECHDTGTYTAGATLDNAKCMVCHDGTPATLVDTHHSTKYGTSENCTDCHNVMRSQLPNASHIKLSLVSFTGADYVHGSPNYDGICETCHTLTDQYRNDNTSPVTNHNVGSVCTSCHTHAGGFQIPSDIADTPHDGITDCTLCHDTGTYVAGATLDNAKCMVCHDGTPATLVDTHHSTKYGTSENCTDCHNVMRSQLPNASHIKLILVSFTGSDYTHGAPNYDGICETCHTLTDQYRNDNTSPVTNHNVGSVCTSCHTHANGMQTPFDPADTPHDGITDCTECHDTGTYTAGATLDNAKCMVCHDGTPATLVDTHHSTKYGTSENCTDCHNVMRSQLPNASHIKLILVSFTGSDYTHGAPNYDGICETCHTLTDQYRNDNTSPVTDHNVGSVCTSCHTHANGMQTPFDPADTPHDGITDCTECHDTGTYEAGATLDNAKCMVCHDGTPATLVDTHHSTKYGTSENCTDCHNVMRSQLPNTSHIKLSFVSFTGSDYTHGAPNYDGICETCHTLTDQYRNDNTSPVTNHNVGSVCTSCHTHADGMQIPVDLADTPHDGITDCTECHDTGTYTAGATLDNAKCMVCHDGTPATLVDTHHSTKYGTSENCTDCHNVMRSQLPNASHIKLSLVSFTGADYVHGTPNYDGICETCHTLTDQYRNDNTSPVTNHNVGSVCTSCHTHVTGMQIPVDLADTPHDGITDCTLCHDTGTYVAGATLDNAKCMVCHDGTPATLVDTHHSTKYGTSENCTDCHNVMRSQLPNASHIKLSLVSFTGADYVHGTPNYDGICETCHTLTDQYRNDNTSPVTNHNVGSVCTSCHTHVTGMQIPVDLADTPHDGITDCTLCHDTGTYTAGATLDNAKCMVCHDGTPATLVDTHHSTKYGTSENCTDCHNVMRSQLPNASHIKLSLVSFTGADYVHGTPNYDGICETCHTLTDQYRNDNTSPVTNHNVGSVCTSCHTHDTGMQIPVDLADTPHDGITDCTECHDTGTYEAGATLDNAKCMVCHDGTPATLVDTHHSTKYGTSENCTDCHNVMRSQLPNTSHIKLTLVSFTGADYVHGSPNYDGICETCHTLTDQYRNDNTSPVTNHNVGSVCTSCHTHADGMQIPVDLADTPHDGITDCTLCHDTGTYTAGATLDNAKCMVCHDGTPATLVDTHHSTKYGTSENCTDCHNVMRSQLPNASHIKLSLVSFTGADYVHGTPNYDGICETCHTLTDQYRNDNTSPVTNHNVGSVCTSCHTHDTGMQIPVDLADTPHDGITDCTECHDTGTYEAGATLDNAKCMVCHDGTPATLVDTHHSTKYGTSENCTDCHNVMRSQLPNTSHIKLTLVSFTGADYVHGSPNYDGICETCHTLTDQYRNDNTSPVTNHNVGSVCTSCHTHADGMQIPVDLADTPHDGITDCTLCHDTGTYTAGATLDNAKCMVCHDGTPATLVDTHHSTKYGTSENCTDCHNVMRSQLPNASHIKLSLVSFTGADYVHGTPNYDGICETCHTLTDQYRNNNTSPVTNHNVGSVCTSCHTHDTGMQIPVDLADTPHDGITDCTECHDTGTYTAGATLDNAKCMVCHDGTPATLVDTHHSTKYGTSENCTDCHNVMRSQLPNTSHIKLTLVSFTGADYVHGSPNYDGICETCHTLTDQYRNDNTSPVTNHNVGSVCTSCHTHADGMQIPVDLADTPHDGITDCTLCHDTGTYTAGATLDNAKCMVCHDGTPATLVDTHHSTKYGTSENCTDCHNVMRSQLPNASHIKLSLVSFTGADYVHGTPNYDGICETCHTLTDQYRNDNTSPVTNHNVGSVCTSCHTHDTGMQIPVDLADTPHDGITDCTECHDTGTYEAGATLDNAKCMVCHDGTPATLVDTHHSTKYGTSENCTDCHNVMRSQLPNTSHIKLTLVSFTGADYVHGTPNYDGICETCHTLTDQYRNDNTSPVTNHNVGSVCTSCHTHADGMQIPVDLADTPHDGITDCTLCHDTGTYTAGATLDNAKCMVCHDGTPATLVDTHHSTKYGTSENCTDCHNVMRSQLPNASHIKLSLVSFTGADYVHGTPNYDGICETCHTLTDQYRNDNTSPVTNHNVGSVCTSCHTHDTGMQIPVDLADTPHDGITDCTECHDTGTYEAGATLDNAKCMVCHDGTPATLVDTHHSTKYGTSENCTDCHNVMRSQLPNASHIKLSLVSFTGADYVHGTPNYDGICETCHTLTDQYRNDNTSPVTNHNVGSVCTSCHTHDTGMQIPVDLADTPHDGITDCTECHDTGTYEAGATLDNAKCMVCHDGTPATLVDTHHSTKYGTSENCTDCHNVMRSQLPNASHIKLSLVSFTGADYVHGTPNYDGICETCHTLTDQYRNDNTSPVTNHNVGSVCTSCHTHDTGMQIPVDLADTPHDGITDCTECHDTGTYEAGATLDNAKCMVCHDGTPATLVDTHHGDTRFPAMTTNCTDCHNVMRSQLPNAKHIKLTLVSFTGADYVHGSPNYDGICETCHTLTNQYRNDNTSPVTDHNVGSVCTSCHTHDGGFLPNITPPPAPHDTFDCTVCHSGASYSDPITNTDCLSCHDQAAPGAGIVYDYSACRTESGTTNILNGNGTRTIALITPIADVNQAFLLLDTAGGATVENGQDHMVSGDIISTTQVQFDRTGATGQVDISYAIVECKNNEFGVESGEITLSNGTSTNTGNLATTVDPARSIVIVSARSNITDTSQSQAHVTGEVIGGGTQVQVTRASAATGADTIVTYQVVEFSVDSGVTVQTGETTLGSGQSTTAAVSVPDLSDAWLYFSYDASDDGPQQTTVTGQITNSTTLTFERHANNAYTNRIRWYVVTFPTGEVTVQRGSTVFSGGSTTHNIGISTVSSVNSAFTFVSNTTADTGGTGGGGGPTVNNYHSDIGTGSYGGMNVSHTSCSNMSSGQVGILAKVSSFPGTWACDGIRLNYGSNPTNNVQATWIFTTPYAEDTPVEGGTLTFHFNERDRATQTVTFELGYVSGGSFTSLGSVSQVFNDRDDLVVSLDMSGITGTAPAGSVLALRLIDTESGSGDRMTLGTGADSLGTVRMTVTETSSGGTTNAYPINRWTEVLSSTSNIQLTNGRGTDTDSNAGFEWQVVEFTGTGPVSGTGADKKVDTHIGNQYNDPTTGALVNLDCVECHNPMTMQTNLSFIRDTLRGNAVVFTSRLNMADGAAPYDGVCEVCHTLTSHYRNDGSSPSMPHNAGAICTDCHLHLNSQNGGGFDKDAEPDAPHDTVGFLANCDYCHVTPTDYVTPVPDSKCNECHTPTGTLKGSYPTALDVLTHSDAGGSGDFIFTQACIDCHNVMDPQLPNIKHVRPDVNGSVDLGSIIAFTAQENAGSFSDGALYRDNICDTCHSDAALGYHHYDGNAPIDQDHNTNTNCAAVCHPHSVGFQPNIDPPPFPHDTQACNTCHIAEPNYATPITNGACMSCHDGSSAVLVDRHNGSTYNDPLTGQPMDLECVECHNPMTAQTNLAFIRDTLRGRTVVFTAFTGPNSFADGDATYDGVCEVCHTQTGHHRFDGSDATAHNDEADCTVACHVHDAGFQAPAGECITCHNGVPAGGPGYVNRDVVGSDFTQASRHVFGGTVSNWDCIVCHREGNAVAATSGTVSTTGVHINSQVEMRNVDSENTGWVWDKNSPPNDAMHSDMDTFCMSCHDSDGASAIAVRSDDAGVTLTPTGAEAARPFNSSDEPSAGTLGGTVDMAGYERTSVLNAFAQFDPANPSHHAVRAPAYNSHDADWGNGAWVTNSLKSGQNLTTVYEAAQLHCADCHTVDSADGGAHGGANGFMLQASSIDGTCFLCHNSSVYNDGSSTLTRWSHDSEGSVFGDDGAKIGAYNGNAGSDCLQCHGGKIGEGGSMVGFDGYGGIHGMSGTDSRSGLTKFRFQGGAYMAHDPGTAGWTGSGGTDWGCYFAGTTPQDWSTCNKHTGGGGQLLNNSGRDMAPQYDRGTPGTY